MRTALALLVLASPALAVQSSSVHATQVKKFGGVFPFGNSHRFGSKIFLDDQVALVMHSMVSSSGVLEEFEKIGPNWHFQGNMPMGGKFWTMSFRGDLMLIGQLGLGRVAVVRRNGLDWTYTWLDSPEPTSAQNGFGISTAIDGSTVVIANTEHSQNFALEGAVYVYEDTGTALILKQSFYGGAPSRHLGMRVAVRGEALLAEFQDVGGWDLRAWKRSNGAFATTQPSVGISTGINWGWMAMEDGLAAVVRSGGGAHVLVDGGNGWFLDQTIANVPSAGATGYGIALSDGVLALSAPSDDVAAPDAGSVYLYARNDGWQLQTIVTANDAAADDSFGYGVAGGGNRLMVGATGQDAFGSDDGAVYEYRLVQSPARVYCVPEQTAIGCVAHMGFSGTPSASSATPFLVTASHVSSHRNGVLVYGTSGASYLPYPGGIRCIAPPRRTTARRDSGGTPNVDDCSGALSCDFNAFVQSGADPLLFAGQVVDAQWVFRDPDGPSALASSEALEFAILP